MADPLTLQDLAHQFRKPSGVHGREIAQHMTTNNRMMIEHGFIHLDTKPGECLVEIGPGYALHLENWIDRTHPIRYRGFDHSSDVVEWSNAMIRAWSPQQWQGSEASFEQIEGLELPLSNGVVDKLITINTLYFVQDLNAWFQELYRILRKGGRACITFALPEFMRQVPFTSFDFHLYELDFVKKIAQESAFQDLQIIPGQDMVKTPLGENLNRSFVSLILQK